MSGTGSTNDKTQEPALWAMTTQADWKRFSVAARRHLIQGMRVARAIGLLTCAMTGVAVGLLVGWGPPGGLLLLAIVVGLTVVSVYNHSLKQAWRDGHVGELTLFLSPTHVVVARNDHRTTFEWSAVKGWSEDADNVYLTIAPLVGWPLPKSGFTSPGGLGEFRQQLVAADKPLDRGSRTRPVRLRVKASET
jgi:hypothetical protein